MTKKNISLSVSSSGEDLILHSYFLKCQSVYFFSSNGRCDPSQQGFGSVLLKALLDNMPLLPAAATGGTYAVFGHKHTWDICCLLSCVGLL